MDNYWGKMAMPLVHKNVNLIYVLSIKDQYFMIV